ncbi:MAG: response regulator, partial [Ignavibacteriaceae bacterium]|nr:response regulator [Ignavibacteriaceae bacterium]
MEEYLIPGFVFPLLLEKGNDAFAVTDKDAVVLWHNKKFSNIAGRDDLTGVNIENIFPSLPDITATNDSDTFTLKSPKSNIALELTRIKSAKAKSGYIVELKLIDDGLFKENPVNTPGLLFQREMQNILTLLIKENSLDILIEEILHRTVSISRGSLGLVIINDEKKESNVIFFDPNKKIKDDTETKNSVNSNFPFLSKWFALNRHSLQIKPVAGTIGYNLRESLNVKNVVISPCFFDNKLVAALVVGKDDNRFVPDDINNIEQFAILLSFGITSITTRELNATLENRLMQAQKLETIGKLTSGMAHDFSNLLSSIFGSLNLLKKRVPPREDITRLLDNIESCSIRAKDLTKGLLSYGKPTPKRKELIKPNILLTEILKVISQTFPKNIIFSSSIEENIYDILGNETEIYQVLLNLCVNAKEAIEESGTIKLSGKNFQLNNENQMEHPLLEKGNYVLFAVEDSGSGIKEENIQKIFDPYFSTKVKETGSGLGLYVTYGIIKAHKGHVEVTSDGISGTKFEVFIPAFEPKALDKLPAPDKIILLADDEIMLRDLLAELLESNGYNVVKVSTGVEALKVLTEEIKADLVIIDYNMPEMNGLECIKKIRDLKFEMPIILSSGSLSLENISSVEEIGINSILSKP